MYGHLGLCRICIQHHVDVIFIGYFYLLTTVLGNFGQKQTISRNVFILFSNAQDGLASPLNITKLKYKEKYRTYP